MITAYVAKDGAVKDKIEQNRQEFEKVYCLNTKPGGLPNCITMARRYKTQHLRLEKVLYLQSSSCLKAKIFHCVIWCMSGELGGDNVIQ